MQGHIDQLVVSIDRAKKILLQLGEVVQYRSSQVLDVSRQTEDLQTRVDQSDRGD